MITHLKLKSYGMQSFQMIGNKITVVNSLIQMMRMLSEQKFKVVQVNLSENYDLLPLRCQKSKGHKHHQDEEAVDGTSTWETYNDINNDIRFEF